MRKIQVQYHERSGRKISYRKYCTLEETARKFIDACNRTIDQDQGNLWPREVVIDGKPTGEYDSLAALLRF